MSNNGCVGKISKITRKLTPGLLGSWPETTRQKFDLQLHQTISDVQRREIMVKYDAFMPYCAIQTFGTKKSQKYTEKQLVRLSKTSLKDNGTPYKLVCCTQKEITTSLHNSLMHRTCFNLNGEKVQIRQQYFQVL